MRVMKMLFAAAAAVMMTLSAQAAKTAKAVVEDGGATLRFVYDNLDYGPQGTNWFSVAEAEAIDPFSDSAPWEELGETVTKVVFDSSFADYRPVQCGSWFYNFEWLSQIEGIGNLKTSSATGMAYMFSGCSSLTSLDLSGFDTAQVTSMNSMFSNCSSLKSLNLSGFDTAKVKDTMWMFNGCRSLTTIYASDAFVTGGITESGAMFASCTSLKGGAGTAYDSARQDKTYARIDGGTAFPGYFTAVSASAKVVVEDNGATLRFVYDDLGYGEKGVDWFSVAEAEAIVDPDNEDVPWVARGGSVTKVVFDKSFADYRPTQCSCWFWNFGKLVAVDGLWNLDTSSAKSLAYMFGKCSKLVSLDLSGFDTSLVTNMSGLFRDCTSLTTIYASEKFVTAQVTQSSIMFASCTSLVGGNGTTFDWEGIAYARIDSPDEPGYFTAVPLIAKVVVEDDGATLRFVYDNLGYGEKDVDWFSVAEAEAKSPTSFPPWHSCASAVTKVVFNESFADYQPTHCGNWFCDFENLETIDGLKNLDTSDATSMIAMFYGCSSLTSLDLSTFDTSEVTSMNQMFEECSSLVSLNLTGFDTAKVTGMGYVFCNCSSLATIYASDSFVTTAVSFPIGMFTGCTALKGGAGTTYDSTMTGIAYARIDGEGGPGYFSLSPKVAKAVVEDDGATLRFVYDDFSHGEKGRDWYSVVDTMMDEEFFGLLHGEVMTWFGRRSTVVKVVFDDSFKDYRPGTCRKWFYDFNQLSAVENIGNLDTSNVTDMREMFSDCSSLTSLDVTGLNTSSVTNMGLMFSGCSSLASLDASGFNTSNVETMASMFRDCSSLRSLDVTGFDTSKVTNMGYMFLNCLLLELLDVAGFKTSNATYMYGVFKGCSSLKSLDLTGFDTSKTIEMDDMFNGCTSLMSLDVTGFDTSNVTNMAGMFDHCTSLTSLDVTGFDTSNVTDMRMMFSCCSSLTSLDVTGFDTAKVTNMFSMFQRCGFRSLDVSGFDTSSVTEMRGMFYNCLDLISLDVTGFDTSKVPEMWGMFYGCSSLAAIFASDRFVTTAVTDSTDMFTGCTALKGGAGTAYDSTKTDATYARIDGGASAPGYFTLKSVGGYAAWAAAKGLTGADAAWDAKPAMWGGTWENGFIYTFGEGLADGTLAIMNISFDSDGKPIITTTPVVEGRDDFMPAVIGTDDLQDWTSPVVLENKSGDDWTLPVGASANFFRVRLSE